MTTRTLIVHGQFEPATTIKVLVDGEVVKDGVVNSSELFSFKTDVQKHGKAVVDITVTSGSITLEQVTATYPASFNKLGNPRSEQGTVTFKQPIDKPMVQFKDGELIVLENVKVTDHLTYDHLMLNGPDELRVTTDNTVFIRAGMDFNTYGDIRWAFKNGFFLDIDLHYEYTPQPCDWITNDNDLNLLKESLYGRS